MLIDNDEMLLKDPLSIAMRYMSTISDEQHKKNIWKAQIRILFPKLEEYRLSLICEYSDNIAIPAGYKHQYGEDVESITDLEFSDLIHLYNDNYFQCSSKIIKILKEYKEVRNCLAHGTMCSFDKIAFLLE